MTIYPEDAWARPYIITIPDGAYEVSTLNSYFQYWSIANSLYMINPLGGFVYFASFAVNVSKYAVELQTIPFVMPVGWTLPVSFPILGVSAQWNAVFTFPSGISTVLGFAVDFTTDANSGGTFLTSTPNGGTASNNVIAYLSSVTPQVQANPSVLMSCSGIQNRYSHVPVLYAFTSAGVSFGNLIQSVASSPSFSSLIPGSYVQLRIQFLATDYSLLQMRDPNTTILLTIKET
jgi:hypothetical protein